jgi:hypothetical protein
VSGGPICVIDGVEPASTKPPIWPADGPGNYKISRTVRNNLGATHQLKDLGLMRAKQPMSAECTLPASLAYDPGSLGPVLT